MSLVPSLGFTRFAAVIHLLASAARRESHVLGFPAFEAEFHDSGGEDFGDQIRLQIVDVEGGQVGQVADRGASLLRGGWGGSYLDRVLLCVILGSPIYLNYEF